MSRFHVSPCEDRAEINLSPMLDVVFIMLIFFIVVASFIKEQGLAVSLPAATGRGIPEFESITVSVEAGSTFVVNGRSMARASVRDYVRALHGENLDAGFVVILGAGSKLKDTALAVDAGRLIGHEVITLIEESSLSSSRPGKER